jgi:electron transport complex protein RnfD
VTLLSVLAASLVEAGMERVMNRPYTFKRGTSILTGLLLAALLPPATPWWAVIVGAAVAVFLGRQLFGGLGANPFNAVLVGLVVLQLSWPAAVETFYLPRPIVEGLGPMTALDASELPLGIIAHGAQGPVLEFYPLWSSLIGGIPGGIGSTSVLALAIGGLYLMWRRVIPWEIPVGFLGGLFGFALICWLIDPQGFANPLYHVMYGYALIGAFFLAPDPASSPYTRPAMLIYAACAGILTMIIRYWGAYQEGVVFAILFFNALTPVLDRIKAKSYGAAVKA